MISGAFPSFQYPQLEFLQQGNAFPFDQWKVNYIWLYGIVNLIVYFILWFPWLSFWTLYYFNDSIAF